MTVFEERPGHVGQLLLGEVHRRHRVLDALTDDVELALEVGVLPDAGAAPDETSVG